MFIGYARYSTEDLNASAQLDALNAAGCERVFVDKGESAGTMRPGLDQAFSHLRAGDKLVVWRLDRLGRTTKGLVELLADLQRQGIHFQSIIESIDTSTPIGQPFFQVMQALARMERDLLRERTNAGLSAARARGKKGGRKRKMTDEMLELAKKQLATGADPKDVAASLRISLPTLYRWIPAGLPKHR